MSSPSILTIENLTISLGTQLLVREAGFSINPGEMAALVGGSGSGKTLTALSIMRLLETPPFEIKTGRIDFEGRNLLDLSEKEMRAIRGTEISIIFQNALSAFNPTLTIGRQMEEAIRTPHLDRATKKSRILEMLDRVGIANSEFRYKQYPFEYSGGMCQRALIGMALLGGPKLLIADEPTTALDATLQIQIMELLKSIQKTTGISILLITHDMGIVSGYADTVIVMNKGRVVEKGSMRAILSQPSDPYTQTLLESRYKEFFHEPSGSPAT
jgi:ABC-type dipeptide/oligopeptide/nickel transport system ATPase component